jgi:hypothetical protein
MLDPRRRWFLTLLGGAAVAWPFAALAQPADRIARVGFFGADRSIPLGATLYQAFIDELQIHGFKNGQNLSQIRTSYQSQDCQGAGPRSACNSNCPRRRGDRMIGRRGFITLLGGAAIAWPLAARAMSAMPMQRGRI